MIRRILLSLLAVLAISFALTGCRTDVAAKSEYQMGEKVPDGPLSYTVVEKIWQSQLGQAFQLRVPENRFMMIALSATNTSTSEVSVPLLQLEASNGKTYQEIENGEGVDNWFGILRTIEPGQTQQGRILFDVPLGSYRLKLSDGNSASEKFTYVQIPLQLDDDAGPASPMPGK